MTHSEYAPATSRRGFRLSTQDVTVAGALGAVALVLGYTPLGLIPLPGVNATTLHIPAIVAGILAGPIVGAFVGAIFGMVSFLRHTNPAFGNPLIALGPRILIGVGAALVFSLLHRRYARSLSAVALGAVIFTILGPGAARFEAAYRAGKIAPTWLNTAYHTVVAATAPQPWLYLSAAVTAAVIAYWLLAGENAAPAAAAVAGTLTNTVGVLSLMVALGFIPSGAAFVIGATYGLPEMLLAVLITVPVVRAVSSSRKRG